MDTKSRVLSFLAKNSGAWVTGESLASSLGVTRAAVWKAVSSLRENGHLIEAASRRGYRFRPENDVLSEEAMAPFLKARPAGIRIYDTLESTNTEAKKLALNGAAEGTFVFADGQSAGRGRKGRGFYSPAGTGVYMSAVLRPETTVKEALTITGAAAVAVCRAIEAVFPCETSIKWVNDIMLNGRKVCGILTEAAADFESGSVESVVLGIGVNFCTVFPEYLEKTACSLAERPEPGRTRNRLAAELINSVLSMDSDGFIDEYRRRSAVSGRPVEVTEAGRSYTAFACGIDERCGLMVKLGDGSLRTLRSGEVSVRAAL